LLLLAAFLVVLVALGAGGLVVLRPAGFFGAAGTAASPTGTPAASAPAPVLAAVPSTAPVPGTDAVAAALHGPLSDPRLGTHVAVEVIDVATGQKLFTQNPTDPTTPASTMKLATAVAVLALRGPAYQIKTRVYAGANPGEVVIVGGGDPTLAINATGSYPEAARLDDLAGQVKRALGGTVPTKVIVDSSLFSGPNTGPNWESTVADGGGYVARVTALMTDGGRINPKQVDPPSPRYVTPDLAAGQAFARLLGAPANAVALGTAPTPVAASPSAGAVPVPGTLLGTVSSPPLVRILEEMLRTSDNTVAELMARQVALARSQPATFAGAGAAVLDELGDLGLPTAGLKIADGSGLSTEDRLTVQLLTGVLALAARPDQPALHALFTGLPVAGYSGTLSGRFRSPSANPADGTLRAKTGTLPGVNSLAGYVTDASGRLLGFAVLADHVTAGILPGEAALDRVGTALAAL
jgi:D-alanyl-D-alanine carboxypeptidase/D-alanyl-D-alanine-endopeptidase (penicillin-binding protein 4)